LIIIEYLAEREGFEPSVFLSLRAKESEARARSPR
jgi:hypothetical protein